MEVIISIHAPRTGSDLALSKMSRTPLYFNPRSPHGERLTRRNTAPDCNNFNPRSPHGERQSPVSADTRFPINFNPRSPHGERLSAAFGAQLVSTFQSTLPARGATGCAGARCTVCSDFNPRSPHGERQKRNDLVARGLIFQSTLPARGATAVTDVERNDLRISIHAPRTGSDAHHETARRTPGDFNPRSPHGERRSTSRSPSRRGLFQSTLPARGATRDDAQIIAWCTEFQSTLPARGATGASTT